MPWRWKSGIRRSRTCRHSQELGYDIVSGAYRGIAVPESTPEAIREKLSDMIGEINADPDFRQRMLDGGFALIDVPYGEEMDAFMAEKTEDYVASAQEAGLLD